MSMTKKTFRTKQAIEAFDKCSKCESLPANKKGEVQNEMNKTRARMAKQDEEVPQLHFISTCLFIMLIVHFISDTTCRSQQLRAFVKSYV